MLKKCLALSLTLLLLFALCSCELSIFKQDEPEESSTEIITIPEFTETTTEWTTEFTTEEESTTEAPAPAPVVPVAGYRNTSRSSAKKVVQTTAKKTANANQNTCVHDWAPATCSTPQKCTKCGLTKGNPNPHNWAAANCKSPSTCRNCGATQGSINPNNHRWDSSGTCIYCGKTGGPKVSNRSVTSNSATGPACGTANQLSLVILATIFL